MKPRIREAHGENCVQRLLLRITGRLDDIASIAGVTSGRRTSVCSERIVFEGVCPLQPVRLRDYPLFPVQVKRDWSSFPSAQRNTVASTFWKLYHDSYNTIGVAAHRWLAFAVSASAILTPAGSAMLTTNVVDTANAYAASGNKAALFSSLRLLAALPEEAQTADIQSSLRAEVEGQLRGTAPLVFRLIQSLLSDPSGCFYIGAGTPEAVAGIVPCLQVLKGWIRVVTELIDVHTTFPAIFPAVVTCFRFPVTDILVAAADVVASAMSVKRYPPAACSHVTAIIVEGKPACDDSVYCEVFTCEMMCVW